MLPTIIDHGSLSSRAAHILSLVEPTTTELIHLTASLTSIGIPQIHALLKTLSLSPVLSRIVWLEEANLLTIPASNALLKLLEEPPSRTHFYLTCPTSASLLPTIRSRCQIITLPSITPPATSQLSVIKSALSASAGDRLLLAQTLPSDKAQALAWLASLLVEIHALLSQTIAPNSRLLLVKIARLAHQTHTQLVSNVNVNLALGNLFLHLPKSK